MENIKNYLMVIKNKITILAIVFFSYNHRLINEEKSIKFLFRKKIF